MKLSAYIAEFLGVFTLCFVGMLAIHALGAQPAGLIGIALAHGLAIGVMVTALGPVSGAHFNPAVTIAFWALNRIQAGEALLYILSQFLGGLAGAFAVQALVSGVAAASGVPALPALGGPQAWQAIGLEAIVTFLLVLTVMGTAVDGRAPRTGGLFIGLVIVAGILAIGPLTGAALNPARHWGPAVVAGNFSNFIVWTIGPIIGGLAAAFLYSGLFEEKAGERKATGK